MIESLTGAGRAFRTVLMVLSAVIDSNKERRVRMQALVGDCFVNKVVRKQL
jgi:hypothetical protein